MNLKHLLLYATLLISSGCSLVKLDREMQQAHQHLVLVSGQLQNSVDHRSALVALLDADNKLIAYRIASPDEVFYFITPPGAYQLLAFDDRNNNFVIDTDEPRQWITEAKRTPLTVQPSDAERRQLGHLNELNLPAEALGAAPQLDLSLEEVYQEHPRFQRNYLQTVSLDDQRFDALNTRKGTWEPVSFINELGYGLYLLAPWDEQKEPVIMVHGINSSPKDWAWLADKLDRARFQPVLFHYPGGLPLDNNAYMLSMAIRDLQLRHKPKRLHVIAHSMGGLVARRALQQLSDEYNQSLCLFVTLSTPWAGHPMAAAGVHDVPLDIPLWRDLSPGSPFLQRLFSQRLPEHIRQWQLISYGGNRQLLPQPNDGAVPLASELYPPAQDEADRLYLLDDSHAGILQSERSALLIKRAFESLPRKGCKPD
ncbi:alpha/beta hydrolase [Ectopseudomonas mendocina]|uniref:Alpha/beta hydrolase n=1 Tax=Ectopseudomonas mendocina TaxID=300 RepID=A0ABZ2RGM1_ECTME